MEVNFDNLRKQIVEAYNDLVELFTHTTEENDYGDLQAKLDEYKVNDLFFNLAELRELVVTLCACQDDRVGIKSIIDDFLEEQGNTSIAVYDPYENSAQEGEQV